jgi:hypothetical protein
MRDARDWIIAGIAAVQLTSLAPETWRLLVSVGEAAGLIVQGAQLEITGAGPHTFGTTGIAEPAIKLRTLDPSSFTLYVTSFEYDSVRDNIFFLGYNRRAVGEQEVLGEPSLSLELESRFRAGGKEYMEYNLDYTSADGTSHRRFLAFNVDRATHSGQWAYAGDLFRIERDMNEAQFVFFPKGNRRTFLRYAGGSNELMQIGYDGGPNAPDAIQIGPNALWNPEIQAKKLQATLPDELSVLLYGNYGTPGPKQVSVGAPNSGGPGFRALVVPNQ